MSRITKNSPALGIKSSLSNLGNVDVCKSSYMVLPPDDIVNTGITNMFKII